MTNRELVRFKIDDHLIEAYEEAVSDGQKFLYELDYRPVQDVVIKYGEEEKTVDTDYELNARMGQIKLMTDDTPTPAPEGDVIGVSYKHAAFTDEDIDQLLVESNFDVMKAAIAAVRVLLASSARRFDYQSGHTRMTPSQVFDHLKQLLESLQRERVSDGGQGIIIGERTNEYWDSDNSRIDDDLSRTDIF